MMNGYSGRILYIDLGKKNSNIQTFDEGFARKYVGGNGFAVKILYDGLKPGIDPLSPENIVVFAVGPVTDTPAPGTSRAYVATKSPLTGGFFDSTFGGRFAISQKRTGFEAIVIQETSSVPVYVYINEEGARVLSAERLWGKNTQETIEQLLNIHGNSADVAAIGPAGEAGVRFASISHQWKGRHGMAGRGGIGSVMGSKKLKAVVVEGKKKTTVADPEGLENLLGECREPLKKKTQGLTNFGTPILVSLYQAQGALGTRNLQQEVNACWESISAERLKENYFVEHSDCVQCPVACGKICELKEGEFAGLRWKMPEYETLFALGTMTDNCDLPFIIAANRECDLLGIDTVSMGVTLSFAIECYERGILTEKETGGIPLRFSDPALLLDLIKMTGERKGFGAMLAEGSFRLAERLGPEAKKLLYGVKGLEIPGHSARAYPINAIGYATNTRGGSHHDHRPTFRAIPPDDPLHQDLNLQVEFVVRTQNLSATGDSLTQCRFATEQGLGITLGVNHLRLLNAVTGWDIGLEDLEKIGERIFTLERAFNCREGMGRKDDVLPYRVTHEPIPEGTAKGKCFSLEKLEVALNYYYSLRGWDKEGIPTPDTLRKLGLEFAIEQTREIGAKGR
jgi:aldehyde:ferredoxin oxidoreductase